VGKRGRVAVAVLYASHTQERPSRRPVVPARGRGRKARARAGGLTRAPSALGRALMSAAAPAPAPAEAPSTAAAAASAPAAPPPSASAPASASAAPLVAAGGASDLDGDENEVPGLISAGESDYFSDDGLWLHGWHIAGAPGTGLVVDANGLHPWPGAQLPWHVGGMAHLGGLHGGNLVRLLFGGGCLFLF